MDDLTRLLDRVLTSRVRRLRAFAQSLDPDHPIQIQIMEDEDLIRTSAGGAVTHLLDGGHVIHLDPDWANDWVVAHEIMHIIIHRSGWPKIISEPKALDPIGHILAAELNNLVQHPLFFPVLEDLGFDSRNYREYMVDALCNWPETVVDGPSKLWNAMKVLEVINFGGDYRDRVLKLLRSKQPELIKIASKLQVLLEPLRVGNELGVRRAILNVLDFLNTWITQQSNQQAMLDKKLRVSPIFTEWELSRPACQVTDLMSMSFRVDPHLLWICFIKIRTDKIPCASITFKVSDPAVEPPPIANIRQQWQVDTIEEFFQRMKFRYGVRGRPWWDAAAFQRTPIPN